LITTIFSYNGSKKTERERLLKRGSKERNLKNPGLFERDQVRVSEVVKPSF
jgi:hypothetical protein